MLKRQTSGSVVCPSCRELVSVNIKACPNCDRKYPGMWGYTKALRSLGDDFGFLSIVTWGCIGLYAVTLLFDIPGITTEIPSRILAPSTESLLLFGSTGAIPIFGLGRWWTIFTSAWLHGGLLHIGFNLAWIRYLTPAVAKIYGAGRLVIIYTFSAITCALLTSVVAEFFSDILPNFFHGADSAIGASGALFGLFGALVAYGQIAGDASVRQRYWTWAVLCFFLGFLLPNVDNWGHLGGFLGGYAICRLRWLDPRYREGHEHLLVAIACLALTILSLIASVVHGFWLISKFPV